MARFLCAAAAALMLAGAAAAEDPPGKPAKPGDKAAKPAEKAAKPGDKAEKPAKKAGKRPPAEVTEYEMAYFGLTDKVSLTSEQKIRLHEIYTESAAQLADDAATMRQLQQQAAWKQANAGGRNGAGNAPPRDPKLQKSLGKLRGSSAAVAGAANVEVLKMLTPQQRARLDPALRNWQPPPEPKDKEEEAKPAKKEKKAKK